MSQLHRISYNVGEGDGTIITFENIPTFFDVPIFGMIKQVMVSSVLGDGVAFKYKMPHHKRWIRRFVSKETFINSYYKYRMPLNSVL